MFRIIRFSSHSADTAASKSVTADVGMLFSVLRANLLLCPPQSVIFWYHGRKLGQILLQEWAAKQSGFFQSKEPFAVLTSPLRRSRVLSNLLSCVLLSHYSMGIVRVNSPKIAGKKPVGTGTFRSDQKPLSAWVALQWSPATWAWSSLQIDRCKLQHVLQVPSPVCEMYTVLLDTCERIHQPTHRASC